MATDEFLSEEELRLIVGDDVIFEFYDLNEIPKLHQSLIDG